MAVRSRSLWVGSAGVLSQPPASRGGFLGRRPFLRSTVARWQEATDPQSPEEVVSGPAHTRGAHPAASGRLAMAVRGRSGVQEFTRNQTDHVLFPVIHIYGIPRVLNI